MAVVISSMCLAVPTRVVAVNGNLATVNVQGVHTQARLDALGEPVAIGDYLLVHAGFAIRRLDPEDARETLRLFDEIFALQAEDG